MVAEAQQHHFAAGKLFRLKNRVAVAFLLALHGKADALGKTAHLFRPPRSSAGYFSRRLR